MRNQSGFTLVEIIAVLLILGILAVFAVPKYTGIKNEARIKAALGAISEIKSRATMANAKLLVQRDGMQPTIANIISIINENVGSDFTLTLTESDNNIVITVIEVQSASGGMPVNGVWSLPSQN